MLSNYESFSGHDSNGEKQNQQACDLCNRFHSSPSPHLSPICSDSEQRSAPETRPTGGYYKLSRRPARADGELPPWLARVRRAFSYVS